VADVDGPGLLADSPEVLQDVPSLVEGGRREPTFNAMILPFEERVVEVKIEPPPLVVAPPPPPQPLKPKKQKAELVVPVEKPEREMPAMKPREELPEEWMKRMCDKCDEADDAVEAPAPQTKINLPIVILALCAGYGVWHATRRIMSAVKSAPECAAPVAVDV
jgi:hypothetical protein